MRVSLFRTSSGMMILGAEISSLTDTWYGIDCGPGENIGGVECVIKGLKGVE